MSLPIFLSWMGRGVRATFWGQRSVTRPVATAQSLLKHLQHSTGMSGRGAGCCTACRGDTETGGWHLGGAARKRHAADGSCGERRVWGGTGRGGSDPFSPPPAPPAASGDSGGAGWRSREGQDTGRGTSPTSPTPLQPRYLSTPPVPRSTSKPGGRFQHLPEPHPGVAGEPQSRLAGPGLPGSCVNLGRGGCGGHQRGNEGGVPQRLRGAGQSAGLTPARMLLLGQSRR